MFCCSAEDGATLDGNELEKQTGVTSTTKEHNVGLFCFLKFGNSITLISKRIDMFYVLLGLNNRPRNASRKQ